jgi:hypothetical protein
MKPALMMLKIFSAKPLRTQRAAKKKLFLSWHLISIQSALLQVVLHYSTTIDVQDDA